MKIILSRKGADSSFGGIPSIIMPDGKLVPIPIPGDDKETISYSDINYGENVGDLSSLIGKLTSTIKFNGKKQKITLETKCHFDPDLIRGALPRDELWRGCFGQIGAAQTVLTKARVQPGDLFLFFGWFNKTYYDESGLLKFCSGEGFHMLYGWLQIDRIVHTGDAFPTWLSYHPHMLEFRKQIESNCIYIGKSNATWNPAIRGYGVFSKFDSSLILTKSGRSRSKWDLPMEFKNLKITYHNEKSWKDDYFQSAHRGQEFVVEESKFAEEWGKEIINRNN